MSSFTDGMDEWRLAEMYREQRNILAAALWRIRTNLCQECNCVRWAAEVLDDEGIGGGPDAEAK